MNKDKFKRFVVYAVIALVIGIFLIIFAGTAIVNHNLETEYYDNITEYEESLTEYDDAIAQYNNQLQAVEQFNKNGIVPVTVSVSSEQVNSSPIGNEIYFLYKINGKEVSSSDSVQISVKNSTQLYSYVEDNAETYPDRGSATKNVKVSLEELKQGYTTTLRMSAHETNGKFAGNTAIFETTYTLKIDPSFTEGASITKPEEPAKPTLVQIKRRDLIGHNTPATIILILMIIFFAYYVALNWYEMNKTAEREKEKVTLEHEYQKGLEEGKTILKEELKEQKQAEYDRGYKKGYTAGKKEGKEIGYQDGYKKGHRDGYEEGREDGRRDQLSYDEEIDLIEPEEGFIASSKSKTFHRATCSRATIDEKNLIHFSSRKEAIEAGYKSCRFCKP